MNILSPATETTDELKHQVRLATLFSPAVLAGLAILQFVPHDGYEQTLYYCIYAVATALMILCGYMYRNLRIFKKENRYFWRYTFYSVCIAAVIGFTVGFVETALTPCGAWSHYDRALLDCGFGVYDGDSFGVGQLSAYLYIFLWLIMFIISLISMWLFRLGKYLEIRFAN